MWLAAGALEGRVLAAADFFAAVLFEAVLFDAVLFEAVLFEAVLLAAVLFDAVAFVPVALAAVERVAVAFVAEPLEAAPAGALVAEAFAAGGTLPSFFEPFTTFLNSWPARNAGTEVFFTFTFSPVAGLRAVRAARSRFSKTPKPVSATFSPFCTVR